MDNVKPVRELPNIKTLVENAAVKSASPDEITDIVDSLQHYCDNTSKTTYDSVNMLYKIEQILRRLDVDPEYGSFLPDVALNIRMFNSEWLWVLNPLTAASVNRVYIIMVIFESFKRHDGVKYRLEIETADEMKSRQGCLKHVDRLYAITIRPRTPLQMPLAHYGLKWIIETENRAKIIHLDHCYREVAVGDFPLKLCVPIEFNWLFRGGPEKGVRALLLCSTSTKENRTKIIEGFMKETKHVVLDKLGFLPKEFI